MQGLTAYSALYKVRQPEKGGITFVSAVSTAVGQLVGQLAKLEGLMGVGSTGSDEKAQLLVEKIGFDASFNYTKANLVSKLKGVARGGIDSELQSKVKSRWSQGADLSLI